LRVLGDVRQRLGDDVVCSRLDGPQQALGGSTNIERHGRALGERLERRAKAPIGEDRRVNPTGKLP
jgi:hypothetical protein